MDYVAVILTEHWCYALQVQSIIKHALSKVFFSVTLKHSLYRFRKTKRYNYNNKHYVCYRLYNMDIAFDR